MAQFKRTTSVKGSFKNVIVENGNFVDGESGEIIDVVDILEKVYGGNPIDITTAYKADEDVE